MALFEKLAAATSEEDVKAAYIKALGLKDMKFSELAKRSVVSAAH